MARRCTPSFMRGAISCERRFGAFAAGQAVGDDADMMAAVGLAIGEVEDVAEDAADRRAHRMQNTKRLTLLRAWSERASPIGQVRIELGGINA